MSENKKMLVMGGFYTVSMVITVAGFTLAFKKQSKKYTTIIVTQQQLIQWAANNRLTLDREEFSDEFVEKVKFLNIVVNEV